MRCPTLNELPSPPPGKTGWPWTEETALLTNPMLGGQIWPRVSIVTPSYNQGQFIEETIRSVLLQGYSNLEYLIIDGSSADGSVEVIRKYEPWLAYWISEPDAGQSVAINKGFARATGSILTWLNSDDRFLPGAIQAVAQFFAQYADAGGVYGNYNRIDETSEVVGHCQPADFDLNRQIIHNLIPQPTAFFSRRVWKQIGPLDNKFHYVMDYDLWTRAGLYFSVVHLPVSIADIRFHQASKSVGQTIHFTHEMNCFFDKFFALPDLPPQILALESQARGANYFVMGRLYLKAQQRQEARRAFEHAWYVYPLHFNKLAIALLWLDTILKINVGRSLFRLILQLKHRFGCLDEETL